MRRVVEEVGATRWGRRRPPKTSWKSGRPGLGSFCSLSNRICHPNPHHTPKPGVALRVVSCVGCTHTPTPKTRGGVARRVLSGRTHTHTTMPPVAVDTLQRDSAVGVHAAEPADAVDALRATPRANTLFEELGAVFIMGFLLTWTAVGPPLTFLALHAALAHACPWATAWVALILTLTLAPTGGEWPEFRDARVWDAVRRYFQLRLLTPPLPYLAPDDPAIFAHYPHSVFPWGSVATRGLPETEPRSGLPKRIRPAVATVLLHTPVLRHVLAWLGCIPVTRAAMEAALARGESVGATPEGIAGIFAGSTHAHERVLTSHRGFVKLALRR